MIKKIRIGVFFGGRSAEHDVSLLSAKSIVENIDRDKFEITAIGIDKEGRFHFDQRQLLSSIANEDFNWAMITNDEKICKNELVPRNIYLPMSGASAGLATPIDVAFPVLHGTYGEDGAIQGLFKTLNIPFVGPSVLGSAIGMDKDVAKRLMRNSGIPCAKSITIHKFEKENIRYEDVVSELGQTIFIKPANLGSSVGVSKVKSEQDFNNAITSAFLYDNKIILEEYIKGREIECAILGNESPQASVLGEIVVNKDFYSYEAKYYDADGAKLIIPATLSPDISDNIRKLAVKTFQELCCEGMARVDFFLTEDNQPIVNEINTIPGFTKNSMYPKLWEASGITYSALLEELVSLAIERYDRDNTLRTSVD